MPPSPTLAARDHGILAGHAAGATVLDPDEEVSLEVIRRVLRAAGIAPDPTRQPNAI